MTWVSTWPINNVPQYEHHDTEAEAEAHADQIRRSGRSHYATHYQLALPDEEHQ